MGVLVYWSMIALLVFVCVFLCFWYQIRVPAKNHIMCHTSVDLVLCCINTQQGPSGIKILKLNMCRPKILLSKLAHQMWDNHPSLKETRQKKEMRGNKEGWGFDKIWKGGGYGRVDNTARVLHKTWRGLEALCRQKALHDSPFVTIEEKFE